MGISYRYNICGITENRSVIESTEQKGIASKKRAWDLAIELFNTSPKPWRVCISPKVYKVNGRLVEDILKERQD